MAYTDWKRGIDFTKTYWKRTVDDTTIYVWKTPHREYWDMEIIGPDDIERLELYNPTLRGALDKADDYLPGGVCANS